MKKAIATLLLLSCLFTMVGCLPKEITYGDIVYEKQRNSYSAVRLSEAGRTKEIIYVPPYIENAMVVSFGTTPPLMGRSKLYLNSDILKKIYFPWTAYWNFEVLVNFNNNVYLFSTNVESFAYDLRDSFQIIVPTLYDKHQLNNNHIIKANVTYHFNYEDNPNDGYFFIDLIEETGKLTNPPYDPTREGYNFVGWYKEAECKNIWDFEKDEVIIEFDESGERIYEEIKLFAKWEKQ